MAEKLILMSEKREYRKLLQEKESCNDRINELMHIMKRHADNDYLWSLYDDLISMEYKLEYALHEAANEMVRKPATNVFDLKVREEA